MSIPIFFDASGSTSPFFPGGALKLWLDASDSSTLTTAYQNLTSAVTGTSGLSALVCSGNESLNIFASMTVTVNGTDIYTVQSVATSVGITTITVVGILSTNYVASALAVPKLSQWNDKSGNGNNVVQGTGTAQPIYIPNAENGKSALSFNGSSNLIMPSPLYAIPNGANTIIAVSKIYTETGATEWVVNLSTGSGGIDYYFIYDNVAGAFNMKNASLAQQAQITGLTNTNLQILVGTFNGANIQTVRSNNGAASTNASAAPIATIDRGWIGARTSGVTFFRGELCSLLIYNTLLTSSQIGQISRFLGNQWGVIVQ